MRSLGEGRHRRRCAAEFRGSMPVLEQMQCDANVCGFTAGGKPGLHFSYARQVQNRLREEFDFLPRRSGSLNGTRSERSGSSPG